MLGQILWPALRTSNPMGLGKCCQSQYHRSVFPRLFLCYFKLTMGADTLDFFWASFWAPPLLDLDLVELEEDLDELPEDFFDLFFVSPIAGHKRFGPVHKKSSKNYRYNPWYLGRCVQDRGELSREGCNEARRKYTALCMIHNKYRYNTKVLVVHASALCRWSW